MMLAQDRGHHGRGAAALLWVLAPEVQVDVVERIEQIHAKLEPTRLGYAERFS
jgi:hypothetical protein